jgi:hypothetical protein
MTAILLETVGRREAGQVPYVFNILPQVAYSYISGITYI